MVTALQSKAALRLVTTESVDTAVGLLVALPGSPTARRAALLNSVPEVIGYFSEGSAALAVDFYEEERVRAGVRDRTFVTQFVINDRTVKIRRGIAWASDPLFSDDEETASKRLAEIVQLETAKPYRDTILTNRQNDPESVGWRRLASAKTCRFCRMLADRGAVYRQSTVQFAAHPNCHCTAQPVFKENDPGTEVGEFQYMASRRNKTPATRARVRDYLDANYPE
jgi:hypothetical protein